MTFTAQNKIHCSISGFCAPCLMLPQILSSRLAAVFLDRMERSPSYRRDLLPGFVDDGSKNKKIILLVLNRMPGVCRDMITKSKVRY
jgi:hypothetical protein